MRHDMGVGVVVVVGSGIANMGAAVQVAKLKLSSAVS